MLLRNLSTIPFSGRKQRILPLSVSAFEGKLKAEKLIACGANSEKDSVVNSRYELPGILPYKKS